MTDIPKRKHPSRTGRPPKWDEPRVRYELKLTPTAKAWLQAKGGPEYIESLARKEDK